MVTGHYHSRVGPRRECSVTTAGKKMAYETTFDSRLRSNEPVVTVHDLSLVPPILSFPSDRNRRRRSSSH